MDINLTNLQRQDPKILKIVDFATQVAVYEFNSQTNEWVGDRTEAEGALFVCARISEPFHTIVIINRVCRENFVEHLTADFEIVEKNPYLLYHKGGKPEHIRGIWFYSRDECSKIFNLITKILESSKLSTKPPIISSRPPLVPLVTSQIQGETPDIVTMLNRAQFQYDQSAQKVKSSPSSADPSGVSSLTSLLRQTSGASSTRSSTTTNPGFIPQTPKTPGSTSAEMNSGPSILQRLLSAPVSYENTVITQQQQAPTSPLVDTPTVVGSRSIDLTNTSSSVDMSKSLETSRLAFMVPSPPQLSTVTEHTVLLRPSDLSDGGLGSSVSTTASEFTSLCVSDAFHPVVPLNEDQERFRQAFIYCLQHDSNFVAALYNAYGAVSKH